jgi:hypothetical protein
MFAHILYFKYSNRNVVKTYLSTSDLPRDAGLKYAVKQGKAEII